MLFGVAGIPHSSKGRSTVEGIKTVKEIGLDAMEVQFVRGVRMGENKAKEVGIIAKKLGVTLTVHAPYYINLNSTEKDKFEASIKRLYDSARIGYIFGAKGVVFHPGYYLKSSKQKAYERVKNGIIKVVNLLKSEGIEITLRPETTGKPTQFGELDELIKISQEVDGVLPCVDFAHIHARYRSYNTYSEFQELLNKIEDAFGKEGIKNMHIHLSGIEYGMKGEKEHLNLEESDMNWKDLLKALKDYNADGILICESPNLEEDALMLKNFWHKMH